MTEKKIIVNTVFDSRPASLLVQTAGTFVSKISISMDEKTANAKSIMGIVSLGISEGQMITLTAEGSDEKQAVPAIEQFFLVK
ncbi:MAG: HPr family phosphocarrier protein [Defluviitaleaceae bacterium]|nr:HPr family phosphocarrier protein [Defluviitaleaceae bacterium]